jgi:hypothetical protein
MSNKLHATTIALTRVRTTALNRTTSPWRDAVCEKLIHFLATGVELPGDGLPVRESVVNTMVQEFDHRIARARENAEVYRERKDSNRLQRAGKEEAELLRLHQYVDRLVGPR